MESRITSVQTYVLKLSADDAYLGAAPGDPSEGGYFLRPPYRSLYSGRFETLLVRLETGGGAVGWGEALAPVGPEIVAAIVERLLAPVLVGADPRALRPLIGRLSSLMRERGHLVGHQADALAACDIALHDLVGRLLNVSVAELLGGIYRTVIPTYVSGLPRRTNEERAALASEWAQQGVQGIKLALGHGVREDLAAFDAVAEADPRLRIAVDAHWGYDLGEALRLGRELDTRGALFLEAPLVPEDLEGHRELADHLTTPVAVGETLRNRYEFEHWLIHRAADLLQPDVGRTGLQEAALITALAEVHHRKVAPHHSVGLGIALAAGLQLCAAIENLLAFEYQPTTLPVANRILCRPLVGGPVAFELPSGPGLGIEVDEHVVAAMAEG